PADEVLKLERPPGEMGDESLLADADNSENVLKIALLLRASFGRWQSDAGAFAHARRKVVRRHLRAVRQTLPARILLLIDARMIAAVELVDGAKVGANLVGARAGGEHAVGQEHAVPQKRARLVSCIEFCGLGGDVGAPGLAVQDRAARPAEG